MNGLVAKGGFCDTVGAETIARQQACSAEGEPVQVNQDIAVATSLDQIEAMMLAAPQIDCPVQHHFGPGIYMREAFLPAGTYVMGHAHKDEHMNIMLKGKMAVIVNGEAKVIEGPYIFTGQPGRKFAYIIDDTVFLNAYATEETDVDKLEEMFVDKSDAWRSAQDEAMSMQAIEAAVQKYLWGAFA
jgi:quercetin dioxygenase-like cupin family protein